MTALEHMTDADLKALGVPMVSFYFYCLFLEITHATTMATTCVFVHNAPLCAFVCYGAATSSIFSFMIKLFDYLVCSLSVYVNFCSFLHTKRWFMIFLLFLRVQGRRSFWHWNQKHSTANSEVVW